MTTATSTATTTNFIGVPGASFLTWINRGLEFLWLLAVFMVPLMFLGQEYSISEAQISYVEVPKVALLRALAGLIVLLWSLEWAIKDRAFQGSLPTISFVAVAEKLKPSKAVSALNNWLRVHPTRWLLLAAGLFFGSTFLSTVLSGSITTSVWGEIPGQDGYSAYSIASYGVLFMVIATHLKNQAQLGRLLAAVILMGVLVGLYGTLQHLDLDFLGITESSGGGSSRVTAFMGNTIFAAAVLAMTVPITLVAAALNFHNEDWGNWKPLSIIGQLARDTVFTFLWASILAVQLVGLMFTFSRGPWSGAALAIVVFLSLVVISFGFRTLIRTGLVLGLATFLSVAFLHSQGSVSIINFGEWLGVALIPLGLASTFAVLFVIKNFGRTIVLIAAVGVIIAVAGAAFFAPSALSGRGGSDSTNAGVVGGATASQVSARIASIKTDVLGGFVGGRGTHWKVSWELIKNRPWFEFDDLSLSWLRPLVGYGPDLFRYTYLLESPPDGPRFTPLEPDHAHNFFIHQTVEQGIFGGLTSLALFASVFLAVGHFFLFRRTKSNPVYRLLLIGLTAIVLGRFLEMMVGVARISDLTVLWAIFGLLAASVSFDDERPKEAERPADQALALTGRRNRRRAQRASAAQANSTAFIFRMSIVAILVGFIGIVTWQKSINYVRASVAEGRGLSHFREGDLESTIEELDRAIKLAPGVPNYYNNRAQVFFNYQLHPEIFTEPGCSQQVELPYLVCLGVQSLESNLESVRRQPFNYRANIATANSAFNLQLHDIAVEYYANAASMVPNAWSILVDLAESQIEIGLYTEALPELDQSLAITGDSNQSTRALYLKGKALKELGQFDNAIGALKLRLSLGYHLDGAPATVDLLGEINEELGVDLDIKYFDQEISLDPQDPIAYYFRGLAHLRLGNSERAEVDIQTSIDLGLQQFDLRFEPQVQRAYARLKSGDGEGARRHLAEAVQVAPQNALYNAYYGELQRTEGNFGHALYYSENAKTLDPNLGLASLIQSKIFISLGLVNSTREVLDPSIELDLPTAQDYADRGVILAFLGEYDLAFSDLNAAIQFDPNQARFYSARAKAHANMGNYEFALADFDAAIEKDPSGGEYFISRGVVYEILGKPDRSLADFETAGSLGDFDVPPPIDRESSYFSVFTEISSPRAEAKLILDLQAQAEAARDVDFYSRIGPEITGYRSALQILGQRFLELEDWGEAAKVFTKLINLPPITPDAYRYRGDAYLGLGLPIDTVNDYIQAIFLDPSDRELFIGRGKAYTVLWRYDLAKEDFTEAIRLDPTSADGYILRGNASILTGNPSEAFTDLDHAIEIEPLDSNPYFRRAEAHIRLGQKSSALDDLEQAIRISPTDPNYIYSRGFLRFASTEYDLALDDFARARKLELHPSYVNPKEAVTLLNLGMNYLELESTSQNVDDATQTLKSLEAVFESPIWAFYGPAISSKFAEARDVLAAASLQLRNLPDS